MNYWLLKTEPSSYSWSDLLRDGRTAWDGVRNAQALQNLRQMAAGDQAMIYHSGDERRIVGLAAIAGAAYPDPKADDPKLLVVDVEAVRPIGRPIALSEIKANPAFRELALVRQPRLSVVPVSAVQWQQLLEYGERQA